MKIEDPREVFIYKNTYELNRIDVPTMNECFGNWDDVKGFNEVLDDE